MQNPVHITGSQRISPDITSISCNSSPTSRISVPINQSQPVNLSTNAIADVPASLYEFINCDNGEIKIYCKICSYTSNKKSNFKRHFTNMHFVHDDDGAKLLECCGIRFSTKGEKFQHTKSVHKTGYKCSICHKIFDRPALLQRHLAKHTGKKPYKCSLCSYQTPNKANAKRHIEKKHSDVQEGSILFLTDDGDHIQMETVSKPSKPEPGRSSPISIPANVVKSSADSTSITCSTAEIQLSHSCITIPRPPSATITSSSLSPASNILSFFHCETTFCDEVMKGVPVKEHKKRQVGHSIDMILSQHESSKGNNAPLHPEKEIGSTSSTSSIHQQSLNEPQQLDRYSTSNWSHSSSLFLSDYAAIEPKSSNVERNTCQNVYTDSYASRQGSLPLVFRQCAHGCWHVDNQVTSDKSPTTARRSDMLFTSVTEHFNLSPDLRSFPCLSQTENSSQPIKSKEERDDNEDVIDVVGEDEDSEEDSNTGLQLVSQICKGFGSFSTTEPISPTQKIAEGCQNECIGIGSPPVGSESSNASHSSSGEDVSFDSEYVPKKLRVSRSFTK